ncbi:hypothetical protein N0V83_002718 [Neocucurbitaria cava]|uniref:BTB domain-containing protein n=1 Tax=Neocucurbitaria cava TaxID=798079 RepID=A0A9W8YCQ2_9PLEO|nr:hypothetical protein N0V83_002718 [Neocucurbitaria cava]
MASSRSARKAFIQSDLFTFYIGEEKKPFIVHSKAVAATSEHFRAMINGDMVEAKTRSAEILDMEPSDFARFLEYAYRRNYTIPSWKLDETIPGQPKNDTPAVVPSPPPPEEVIEHVPPNELPSPPPEPEPPVPNDPSTIPSTLRPLKKSTKSKRNKMAFRLAFQSQKFFLSGPDSTMIENFRPEGNSAPEQDFVPVFLAHARLYTFAEMRLVYPLRNLVLHKLYKTLMCFQLYNHRVGDIVELARYAYDHGADRSKDGTLDALRQMVVDYIACEVDTIGKHADFIRLMEDGGEFVSDFWNIVSRFTA